MRVRVSIDGFGTDGLADERINGLIGGWITMDGWTYGLMSRRTDGVRVIHLSIYRFVLVLVLDSSS